MTKQDMDVSENSGTPKSSILIGFSIINHPFWGTTIFGNTYIGVARNLLSRWDFFPGRGRFRAKFVDSFEVNLLQDVRNGRKEWKVRATDSC